MGLHKIEIAMVGGHGCDRTAQPGDQLHGCGRDDCPDCAALKFIQPFKKMGAFDSSGTRATLTHWPDAPGQIVDDLVSGTRKHRAFNMPADPPEHITQFFVYTQLPPHLQDVSRPFAEMAMWILATMPRNQERTVALRKLLEAKDAAVRAMVAKP